MTFTTSLLGFPYFPVSFLFEIFYACMLCWILRPGKKTDKTMSDADKVLSFTEGRDRIRTQDDVDAVEKQYRSSAFVGPGFTVIGALTGSILMFCHGIFLIWWGLKINKVRQ